MKNDLFNTEIDEIIRASMKMADEPAPELNHTIKLHPQYPTLCV